MKLATEFKLMVDKNPSTPILSNPKVRDIVYMGAGAQMQQMGKQMRGNSEVYVGIYLIVGILIGGSNIMAACFYWQMIRMRYTICPDLKAAFAKTHSDILMYMDYPVVPESIRNMYF